jgi:hypothetical protein
MRWPRDGAPLRSIWDVSARLDALACPWARLRIQAQWLFGRYMRRRRSAGAR